MNSSNSQEGLVDSSSSDPTKMDQENNGTIDSKEKIKNARFEDLAQKEEALTDLLLMMDDYAPIIPDAVTDYHLARAGFETDDVRLKRVLALATQKFIVDIASDAVQYAKIRQQVTATKDRKGASKNQDKRTVLTMDDLSAAMAERGVNIRKPDYYL